MVMIRYYLHSTLSCFITTGDVAGLITPAHLLGLYACCEPVSQRVTAENDVRMHSLIVCLVNYTFLDECKIDEERRLLEN